MNLPSYSSLPHPACEFSIVYTSDCSTAIYIHLTFLDYLSYWPQYKEHCPRAYLVVKHAKTLTRVMLWDYRTASVYWLDRHFRRTSFSTSFRYEIFSRAEYVKYSASREINQVRRRELHTSAIDRTCRYGLWTDFF